MNSNPSDDTRCGSTASSSDAPGPSPSAPKQPPALRLERMLQHVLALRVPSTSNQDHARRSTQAAAAVEGVAAEAAELEGPLRRQHLQLIGELRRHLDKAVAQGEEAQAVFLVEACIATLEGRHCATGLASSQERAAQLAASPGLLSSILACLLRWPGNPSLATSPAPLHRLLWAQAAPTRRAAPCVAPRDFTAVVGRLAAVVQSDSSGAADAATALRSLSTLAALLSEAPREGGRVSLSARAREAAAAGFSALASALRGPLRQEPGLLSDAFYNLAALARGSDEACAAAASTPRLAAALAAALVGSPPAAARPGRDADAAAAGGRSGNGDAAADPGTKLRLQCVSLMSCMLTVKSIELRTQVAHEVAGMPGSLAALVRLLANPNPTTAGDAAQTLRLIAFLTPAARGAIMRLPVAAALVSLLRRHTGREEEQDTARHSAIMLASMVARHGEPRPMDLFTPAAVEFARLMAAAPVAMSMVAQELAECDISPAAGLDSFMHAIAASSLVCSIVLAASSSRDDPQILHQIAAGVPALLPAVAQALQRLLDSPCDLKPWLAGRDVSSTAADVGKACLALASATSTLLVYTEAESGGAAEAVQAAAPGLVPSLRRAARRARPANAGRAADVRDFFLLRVEGVLSLLEAGQQAEAPLPSERATPPQATRARAPARAGRASAAAALASTSTWQQQQRCGVCSKTAADGARLRLCSGCHAARFCSDACYKVAWKAGHRQECQAVAAAARGGPGAPAK